MALFSDNPFAGVFRAQKRREAEAAMAQQQAMAEQKQQKLEKQLVSQGIPEDKASSVARGLQEGRVLTASGGYGSQGKNTTYGYGLGGSTPWTTKSVTDPQTGAIKRMPVLKQGYTQVGQGASLDSRPIMANGPTLAPAGKTVGVMGAGTAFKQEYRGIREALGRGGATVIEAPEKFVRGKGTSERDSARQFYSEVTGRPMGTLMGRGAYGGFGKGKQPPQQPTLAGGFGVTQDPSLTQATQLNKSGLGQGGNPLAFTGFGQFARDQKADQYQTPIGRGLSSMNTLGIPSFPFAGAESAFERSARTATTFGGMQMFPYAGY